MKITLKTPITFKVYLTETIKRKKGSSRWLDVRIFGGNKFTNNVDSCSYKICGKTSQMPPKKGSGKRIKASIVIHEAITWKACPLTNWKACTFYIYTLWEESVYSFIPIPTWWWEMARHRIYLLAAAVCGIATRVVSTMTTFLPEFP